MCSSRRSALALAAVLTPLAACTGDNATGAPQVDASPEAEARALDSTVADHDASAESSFDGTASDRTASDRTASEASTGADAMDATWMDADASDGPPCSTFDGSFDPAAADAGKALVAQYQCTKCHGSGLIGSNTSISDSGGLVYPSNLTSDPTTGLGCWTDDHIARAILDAIDDQDADLCLMPHFRDQFAEAGIDPDAGASQIVQFLRGRLPVQHTVPNTVCPSDSGSPEAGPG